MQSNPKLTKQPLTYVLAQVKFTSIEDMPTYIPQLQGKIRDNFPYFEKIDIQAVQFHARRELQTTVITQWHFIDKKKQTGIILDKQSLTIHSNNYAGFSEFMKVFEAVIKKFDETLDFSLLTRLGLRYINLIEEGLQDLDPRLQGFSLTGDNFLSNNFMAKTETTQLTHEGMIKIQSMHIENSSIINSVENIFVMPELINAARFLSFEHLKKPQGAFLILDIDHFNNREDDFAIPAILESFAKFHQTIYSSFCLAVGEENLRAWT